MDSNFLLHNTDENKMETKMEQVWNDVTKLETGRSFGKTETEVEAVFSDRPHRMEIIMKE
jgi:hypothetical protein